MRRYAAVVLVLGVAAAPAAAQDRRTLVEPQLPTAACVTLSPTSGDRSREIEAALRRCRGAAVRLGPGLYESGPIEMPSRVTLWLEPGATLRAIPDPRRFDAGQGLCGTIDTKGHGCRPLIHLADATDAAIMGAGTIDGAGGAAMAGGTETWWQLARRAQREGGKQNVPRLVTVDGGRNLVLYATRFANAANFHVAVNHVRGFTAWGVTIDAPADARNTDGIDPGASEDVTIAHSRFSTGDDDIAIKAGNGGGVRYVSILDSHVHAGHGVSIGSETVSGVSDVLVRGLTFDGTTSGLRIKSDPSRGGLVQRIRYQDICLRGVARPIDFDTRYDPKAQGGSIPVYRDIVLANVQGDGGQLIARGYDARHPLDVTLDGVRFPAGTPWQVANATLHIGPGGATPLPPGVTGPAATVGTACAGAGQ